MTSVTDPTTFELTVKANLREPSLDCIVGERSSSPGCVRERESQAGKGFSPLKAVSFVPPEAHHASAYVSYFHVFYF